MEKQEQTRAQVASLFFALGLVILVSRLHPLVVPAQVILWLIFVAASMFGVTLAGDRLGWKRIGLLAWSFGAIFLVISRFLPTPIMGDYGCSDCVHTLCGGIETYSSNHKGKYPDNLNQLVPECLKQLPTCPNSPNGFAYEMRQMPDTFTVSCRGKHFAGLSSFNSGWVYSAESGLRDFP